MGVGQQTISNIESSEEVEDEQLDKVAKAMGVTANTINNPDEVTENELITEVHFAVK